MEATENISNFCRICAQHSEQTEHLFETMYNELALSEMLAFCLKRPISETKDLPNVICTQCQENLISTYNFHTLCESSERFLLAKFASGFEHRDSYSNNSKANCANKHNKVGEDANSNCKLEAEFISELVCVEEQLDENMLSEENFESSQSPVQQNDQMSMETKKKLFECFECKKIFKQQRELKVHIYDHDSNRKSFICTVCKMQFRSRVTWYRHRFRHMNNVLNCEYCDEKFIMLSKLKQHIQDIHKSQLNTHQCDQCSEAFPLKFLLTWHIEWHKNAKKYACTACDSVFFSERKLNTHIRMSHGSKFSLIYASNSEVQ